jgi:hypothetical protein
VEVKKTLLKVLFSAAAAVVLLVSVYLVLGRDLKDYGGLLVNREEQGGAGFLRDLVGRSVELEKQTLTEVLAANFERRIDSENNKIDFLLEQMSSDSASETAGTGTNLLEFVESYPLVEKAHLINSRFEILLSTSDDKPIGSVLDREIYSEVFTVGMGGSLVDETVRCIVLYRNIDSGHALLFYYGSEFLQSIFSDVPGFAYESALLSADRVIFINFPVVAAGDRENFRNLSQTVLVQQSGFVRVRRDQFDKTIYFLPVSQTLSPWIVAVTYDIAQVRISRTGALILVVQALVVAAIIIFILTTVKERKKLRIGGVASETKPVGSGVRGGDSRVTRELGQSGSEIAADRSVKPASVGPPSPLDSVIPLDDVEVVEELDEVGEAEVADEYDDSQLMLDGVPDAEAARATPYQSQQAAVKDNLSRVQDGAEGRMKPLNDSVELEKLEAVQREIMGPEAQMLEEIEELDEIEDTEERTVEEPVQAEIDESVVDDLTDIEQRNRGGADILPDLEALVGVDTTSSTEGGAGEEAESLQKDFAAPGGGSTAVNDELHGNAEGIGRQGVIRDTFRQFLETVGINKGAVLLKQKKGTFKPCVITGFSRETNPKLIFSGKEKIVTKVLQKDKILYIRKDAFMDDELREKFSHSDTSTIKSIFFAPLYLSGAGLAGFFILSPTINESFDSSEVLVKIKEIKRTLTSII